MGTELADVKDALRVTHDDDDALLTRLISSALREYVAFTNSPSLPDMDESSSNQTYIPEDAFNGVILMVQADYDADPLTREKYRQAAEALWMPYATIDRLAV